VAVTQRNLTNFTCTEIRRFAFDGDSRVLQFAALSFDASLSEICTALCAGGSLYLPTPEQALPGPALADLLLQAGITHVKLPPSALAVLPKVAYPALQVLMTIGEACTVDQIAFWSRGRRFCNGYGPTEATIGITGAEGTDCTAAPPIGRPYDNTQIYVLDAHRHPVPIGVAGELYIGGEQIARGYWKRPQLTADKFIPAAHFPFAAQGTLYRTGDLVRYLPDGNLDFIGRIDQMVKLRGMRIELGEIETTLNQHALVQESVVIVHEYAAGDQRLVAYVVTPPPVGDMVGDVVGDVRGTLLTYLKHKLPPYMAPAALVLVAAFPTLPNGKVDRKALPLPSAEDWHSVPFVAPRTETEQIVAEIWADLLKQPQVGVYDNFFALGGHSLLVTEVCFRLQAVLGLAVGVRTIFEHPTIAALAEQLDEQTLAGVDETMLAHLLNEVAAA
jgi:acyl-coenzyme A synthetase/AMP-(fatty) acid ligase